MSYEGQLRVVRQATTKDGRTVDVWGVTGPRSGPDDMVTGLYELLYTNLRTDPVVDRWAEDRARADERAAEMPYELRLKVHARLAAGLRPKQVAAELGLSNSIAYALARQPVKKAA